MNAPFSRLLLATEHTDYDAGAERVALALAARCGLPLAAVMPLVSNPEYESVAPQLAERADAEASIRLAALAAAAQASGVNLSYRVRRGPEPDQEIVDEARAQGSDLIIARRRGKRGFLARLLVGEMVSRVVAHAPCSVLLVPRASGVWSRGVLVALDPAQTAAARAPLVDTAVAVAADCGLPLSIVSVAPDASDPAHASAQLTVQSALQAAQARQVPVQGEVRMGHRPFEHIVASADARRADLLIVGRHGGALHGRAFLGSTTQKVIGLAERPVLVAIPRWVQ